MIIHNATQLTTEFIAIDDDGNVIDRKQAQQVIINLAESEFVDAYNQIVDVKAKLEQSLEGTKEDAKRDKDNRPSE